MDTDLQQTIQKAVEAAKQHGFSRMYLYRSKSNNTYGYTPFIGDIDIDVCMFYGYVTDAGKYSRWLDAEK